MQDLINSPIGTVKALPSKTMLKIEEEDTAFDTIYNYGQQHACTCVIQCSLSKAFSKQYLK